ncbi:Ni/Fe hydrogenase subunit alpha [Candidatus Woesearchaeota archaeon]|nr:MAG: Ni/Fe hydrogenase subunit alpha [Candidatus Woesearchaeota archaeon]
MVRRITLNHITKIEGHASLDLKIRNGKIEKCHLEAVEGSRYFEGMVKGRRFDEAPEITSRICGICSCAHTTCSVMAMENALGITPSTRTIMLRELVTIGERIRSHATHLYFLSLPDFYGYESALAMSKDHRDKLQVALRMMKAGNELIKLNAGRDLHPISLQIGKFLKEPTKEELGRIRDALVSIIDDTVKTAELFATLDYPDFERETEYFSLVNPHHYALLYGNLKSQSSEFEPKDYKAYLGEYHEEYATANFVVKEGKSIMVGALPRMNNNWHLLKGRAKEILDRHSIKFPSKNPFHNNYAQALELVYFTERAIELIDNLPETGEEVKVTPRAGHGIAAIEVPRGILWHEYELDENGNILYANIITPTAQNLRNMQDDIREFVPRLLDRKKDEIVLEIEKLIRAYDPCFSCSTHFLKVNWE